MRSKSKLKMFASVAIACLTLSTLSGCETGGSDEGDEPSEEQPAPTDGSQSRSDLAGYAFNCEVLSGAGSLLNGKVIVSYLELNADGTYSYSANILSATTCLNGHAGSSSSSYSQYNVNGAWTVNGTNTLPATSATKIQYVPTSATLQIFTPQSVPEAAAIGTWANGCTGGTGGANFSNAASQSKTNFFPTICNATSDVNLGVPPSLNVMQYNTASRISGTFRTGLLQNKWSPSAGSHPTSYSGSWY